MKLKNVFILAATVFIPLFSFTSVDAVAKNSPPRGAVPPAGMTPPAGMQRPGGMTPPADMQRPGRK